MDTFGFHFDTNSLLTDDTNSDNSDLDWTAFQPTPPTATNSPLERTWFSQHDDAVAPNDRLNLMIPQQDDKVCFQMEHIFNGFNQYQEQQSQKLQCQQEIAEPMHVNIHIPDQIRNDMRHDESLHRVHLPSIINEGPPISLPAPLVPRLSSSRSHCYHKLPDHAVKLMQEWYNAHLDDPYPRSIDKKRFITEGNITPQQCRSWFANRRQRLKHVKRNQPKGSLSHSQRSIQTKLTEIPCIEEEQQQIYEHCYHCQQQATTSLSLPLPLSPNTTTTVNVVINQQTVEQLIHNSLRKLFNPAII